MINYNVAKECADTLRSFEELFNSNTDIERMSKSFSWRRLQFTNIFLLNDDALIGSLLKFEQAFNKFIDHKCRNITAGFTMIVSSLLIWLFFCFFCTPPNYAFWIIAYLIFTVIGVLTGLNLITNVGELEIMAHETLNAALKELEQVIDNYAEV